MKQPQGLLRRAWVRLFGESDAIERQLSAVAREGATLARIAHVCAFAMLILFSAGSLVALAGDSLQAIASGRATFPDMIAAGVSGLLVACMDVAMLYAASMLRLLALRRAAKAEGRLHRWVLFSVAVLEGSTYAYMSALYEHPSGVAWALIGARAGAAPLLSVYLSLARPLPVMARDMLALSERFSGEGMLRDLARIASDTTASLADKVALYIASAVIAPDDKSRLAALLEVAQQRWEVRNTPPALLDAPTPSPEAPAPSETPSEPPQKPREKPIELWPHLMPLPAEMWADVPTDDDPPKRARKPRQSQGLRNPRKKGGKVVRLPNPSVQEKARAAWVPGMSIPALQKAAGISRPSAQKYHAMLTAEAAQAEAQENEQAAQ